MVLPEENKNFENEANIEMLRTEMRGDSGTILRRTAARRGNKGVTSL